jgi:spoIIIJ-associated protein
MRSVEVEGDSIDDAIQRALAELGITRDRAAIEILNDASRGILGCGAQKARVRATVRPPLAESLARIEESGRVRVSRETIRTPTPERELTRRSTKPLETPAQVSRETRSERHGSTPNVERAPAPAEPKPNLTVPPVSQRPAELATRSREVLLEMLKHLGVRGDVSFQPADDGVAASLAIQCEASALLIGKRGQTLDAIEYLLNRIVVREASGTRIEVDVEGYRARRRESLSVLARRMAEKVRDTGKPATVDLLSPRDRRVVHLALKDEAGVTSRSHGEGFLRKLVILPGGKRRGASRPAADGE